MVMDGNYMHGLGLRMQKLGHRLVRPTATLPQTAAAAIFNINVGIVKMTLIIGRITTVLGAVGNMSLEENPTVGTTEVLCAVIAAGAFAQDDLVGISGVPAEAMLPDSGATGGIPGMTTDGVMLRVGTLDLRLSASSTGSIEWTVFYIPMEDGAYMSVA